MFTSHHIKVSRHRRFGSGNRSSSAIQASAWSKNLGLQISTQLLARQLAASSRWFRDISLIAPTKLLEKLISTGTSQLQDGLFSCKRTGQEKADAIDWGRKTIELDPARNPVSVFVLVELTPSYPDSWFDPGQGHRHISLTLWIHY
jgi:hypothetical protein